MTQGVFSELGFRLHGGVAMALDPNGYLSNTGIPNESNTGNLYTYHGPDVHALLSTRNIGPGYDILTTADPSAYDHVMLSGSEYFGVKDAGDYTVKVGTRTLVSNLDALILKDSYGYTINSPASLENFYTQLEGDINGNTLFVRGGQHNNDVYPGQSNPSNDTFTIDTFVSGGQTYYKVSVAIGNPVPGTGPVTTLTSNFLASDVAQIQIEPGDGDDTINIHSTTANTTTTVADSPGYEQVNVGNGGLVKDVLGTVTVLDGKLTIDDQADTTARTATLDKVTVAGNNFAKVTGLAPGTLNTLESAGTLTVITGTKADTVNVFGTAPTTIVTSSGGFDAVNIGKAGDLSGVTGYLTIQNPPSYSSLNIDDSADLNAKTVTLKSVVYANQTYGTILGLAPGLIDFVAADVSTLKVTTGKAADTVKAYATVVPTTVSSSNGADVVQVGQNGSVQGIAKDLTIANNGTTTQVMVDDSADPTARTLTVDNMFSNGSGYGRVSGLAPANINFLDSNTASLYVQTGSGVDTVTVRSTVVPTTVTTTTGHDSVTVGSAGSVQSILSPLTIRNVGSTSTLILDDSADATGRTINLDSFTPAGDSPFGSLTGLAPGAINFRYADVSSVTLKAGKGADTLNVLAKPPVPFAFQGGLGSDTLVGPSGDRTWHITATDAGNLEGNLTFSAVENLQGSDGQDTFIFDDGKSVTGVINGGPGNDTLDFSAYTTAVSVDLGLGTSSATGGVSGIEVVKGGSGNDILSGDDQNNVLIGNGGNDTLSGNGGDDTYVFDTDSALGNDTITESGGNDTLDFSGATAKGVTVNLGLATAQVVNSNLTLTLSSASSIENVVGTPLDDNLTGNALNNMLNGGSGNDTYYFDTDSALGNDSISESGGGTDTLDFSATTTKGVTVNLGVAAAQVVNNNLTLTLGSAATIENVVGTSLNDSLAGNSLNNILNGGAGNDLYAFDTDTQLGNDTISESGMDTDTLSFAATTTKGVTVNLGLATAQVVNSNLTLTLGSDAAIENVLGGTLDDRLTGNSRNNILNGLAGNDIYFFDTDSALGNDTISESGVGSDTLDFSDTTSKSVSVNLGIATAQVVNSNLNLTFGAANTIENVIGGALDDNLTGNGLANVLSGGAGNDTITGGDGRDILLGGAGQDVLSGGNGADLLLAAKYSQETNIAALNVLMAEWGSSGATSYEDRIGHLTGTLAGGLNGVFLLTTTGAMPTVTGDGATATDVDTLTGGNGRDWFLSRTAATADNVTDQGTVSPDAGLETITSIP